MRILLIALGISFALAAQDSFRVKVSGHGPAMILVPGLACSGEVWDGTVAHYQSRFQCHVLTLAGFAGVPAVAGPFLDRVRDELAVYIRGHALERPVLVGHSLGGNIVLGLASRYPGLPGKLVMVDSYPFLDVLSNPKATPESAKADAAQMKEMVSRQTDEQYRAFLRSGATTRAMVSRETDLQRLVAWNLASDRTAMTNAVTEVLAEDLRPDLTRVKTPALVLASWIGYKQMTDHART